jgi:hypothetical protein
LSPFLFSVCAIVCDPPGMATRSCGFLDLFDKLNLYVLV